MVSLAAEQQTVVSEGKDVVIHLERAVVTNTNTTVLLGVVNTKTPGEFTLHKITARSTASAKGLTIVYPLQIMLTRFASS